jgi:transposase-like protein
MTDYSDDIKARCLAALLAGQTATQVAATFGVPVGTLRSWKSRHREGGPVATVAMEKRERIGTLLLEYLEEGLTTLREQVKVFRDPDWLKKQPASELAVLHGVVADKQIRLLEALAVPDEPSDEGVSPSA